MNDDFMNLDLDRQNRRGFPEAVYCPGKSTEQILAILQKMLKSDQKPILATRIEEAIASKIIAEIPDLQYIAEAHLLVGKKRPILNPKASIAVITAGTSDIPVAEEAAITAEYLGNRVERFYDLGVAGLHRILEKKDAIRKADVLIVVAGMEGALPSVISGLTAVPILAVPTSQGYGSNFQGLSALLAMLNSCSPGVSVVNIDNGFGAACSASLINEKLL